MNENLDPNKPKRFILKVHHKRDIWLPLFDVFSQESSVALQQWWLCKVVDPKLWLRLKYLCIIIGWSVLKVDSGIQHPQQDELQI